MRFWDSSAIVSLLVEQVHTRAVERLALADDVMALWWLTPVECVSALQRLKREVTMDAPRLRSVGDDLTRMVNRAGQIDPEPEIPLLAMQLLERHPLRAADALQLAAAIALSQEIGLTDFVCCDNRLREAAAASQSRSITTTNLRVGVRKRESTSRELYRRSACIAIA